MQCLHIIHAAGKFRFVSRNCYESRGKSVARLIELAAQGLALRDCQFLVNTSDHPGPIGQYPTFSFSTIDDNYSAVCPDFLFDAWPEVQIDDYTKLCAKMAQAGATPPLSSCIGWIGVPMVPAREQLVELGQAHPDVLEAIDMRWDRANPSRLTSKRFVSLDDQVRRWKYLIDVEGCGWSARLKTFLWSGRVAFLAERPWKEWFFPQLEPWRHYVPVRRDLSDLVDNYRRIEADPSLQRHISEEAQAFARQHLSRAASLARWRELLLANFGTKPAAYVKPDRAVPSASAPARTAQPVAVVSSTPVRRVVVVPAGRRRYLEILFAHLLKQKNDFDELRLWLNTTDAEDLAYCHRLAAKFPWIKAIASGIKVNGILSIFHFFTQCTDTREHYLRLDDDVVYLEPGYIARTFAFRAQHPEYFLVFGNIINNAILAHLHQRFGHFQSARRVGYLCMDEVGWKDGAFAEELHRAFLTTLDGGTAERWHFDQWVLDRAEHVSINSICWRGVDFAAFQGSVGIAEEIWLTVQYPNYAQKVSVIFGGAVCAHFAFGPQRAHLDQTNLLARYAHYAGLKPAVPVHHEELACSPS